MEAERSPFIGPPNAERSPEDEAKVTEAMRRWEEGEPERQPKAILPSIEKWQTITTMAAYLAPSQILRSKRLNTPSDVGLVLLAAHDLGIHPTTALSKLYVIEGKLSMSAEFMLALVVREGHDVWPVEWSDKVATIAGRRAESERVVEVTWTIEMAQRAGLFPAKDNWKHYPEAMLWARAVSQLCRMRFADVLCGLTYTPEELGAVTDEHGDILDVDAVDDEANDAEAPISAEERQALIERARKLPDDLVKRLNNRWAEWTAKGNLRPIARLRRVDMAKVEHLFAEIEALAPTPEPAVSTCEVCGVPDGDHEPGCPEAPDFDDLDDEEDEPTEQTGSPHYPSRRPVIDGKDLSEYSPDPFD